ncbi:hypothetical protein MKW92_010075 [Papaver armeniacum]|nr:hypothetical protein MKW92_010075 [Papaver armeniacum]
MNGLFLNIISARIFFQSLDAAVLLFSRVTNISIESLMLPDGTIHGENQISHLLDLFDLLIRYFQYNHLLTRKKNMNLVILLYLLTSIAINRTYGDPQNCTKNPVTSQYVIALLVVPKDGQIPVDV